MMVKKSILIPIYLLIAISMSHGYSSIYPGCLESRDSQTSTNTVWGISHTQSDADCIENIYTFSISQQSSNSRQSFFPHCFSQPFISTRFAAVFRSISNSTNVGRTCHNLLFKSTIVLLR